jgi:hypothetical protein
MLRHEGRKRKRDSNQEWARCFVFVVGVGENDDKNRSDTIIVSVLLVEMNDKCANFPEELIQCDSRFRLLLHLDYLRSTWYMETLGDVLAFQTYNSIGFCPY